jgi:hypothetical protein
LIATRPEKPIKSAFLKKEQADNRRGNRTTTGEEQAPEQAQARALLFVVRRRPRSPMACVWHFIRCSFEKLPGLDE